MAHFFRRSKGFTLIELLTAMAITAILLGGLASLLMSSSKVIEVLNGRRNAVLENALISIEKMKRELNASPVYPSVPFVGKRDSLSFPKFTTTSADAQNAEFKLGQIQEDARGQEIESGNEEAAKTDLNYAFKLGQVKSVSADVRQTVEKVEYYFDASKKALIRRFADQESVVIEGVKSVRFSYALAGFPDLKAKWEDETPITGTDAWLQAILVSVEFDPENARYSIPSMEKTFPVWRRHPMNCTLPDFEAPVVLGNAA